MEKVRFPKLSANLEEATIAAWHKQEGDYMKQDDILLEMATDKGVVEVEAPCEGTLVKKLAAENSTLPVGYIIALAGDPAEALPDVSEENERILAEHRAATEGRSEEGGPARKVRKKTRSRVRATPAARRKARDEGVDLNEVKNAMQVEKVDEETLNEYLLHNPGTGKDEDG